MKAIITIITISFITLSFYQQLPSHKAPHLKRNRVQQIYTTELGVREKTGNNDGPRIEEYLRHVKLKRGDPWCAAFVCWVFDQSGITNPRTGWSPGLFPKAKVIWERGREVAVKKVAVAGMKIVAGKRVAGALKTLPQKADVFGIWFPDKGRIAHVGFVDSWGDQWLITVEGNTNEAGSREGDGVWRKRRQVASVWQVSDFITR